MKYSIHSSYKRILYIYILYEFLSVYIHNRRVIYTIKIEYSKSKKLLERNRNDPVNQELINKLVNRRIDQWAI